MHRAVVNAAVLDVSGHSPLRCTRNVRHRLSLSKLYACRDIEVIEDVERLGDSLSGSLHPWCRGLEEGGPDEPRRRSHVSGNAMESCPASEGRQHEVANLVLPYRACGKVDVVVEVGEVPLKTR